MQNKKITVFGATGKIGSELIALLSAAGIETIAISRNPDKAIRMPCVQWVQADMSSRESLYKTMEDADTVFLLSGHNPDFVEEQSNVISVARELGVKHIVKLSSAAADKDSPFSIARVHGEVEEILRNAGIANTLLRPTGMMQNWLGELAHSVKTEGKIYDATGEGKRAYVDIRDIAEVAFRILLQPEPHAGHSYFLTGGTAVNYGEVAETISRITNQNVTFVSLSIEELRQRMQQQGKPEWVINTLLAYTQLQRDGKTAAVSTDVETVLHQPARTINDFFRDYKNAFLK
ncbi:SDR family oxidoreductase [Chryseobacterium camelliae]|uniref:SDR family oxidoreductase n=1 Tax=Chryseobacterium camelliae TaxID=1265445 RepID=UPI002858229D|nr:SDR family oxidoreductase [Chryseobacterium camelliae]MDR6516670.1 uncharacterized protein YbjT (DUF2867 family) [Chryseobacterium camelliae]